MNIRRWLISLGACLLLFVALGAFKTSQIKSMIAFAESFPEPSETVETEQVVLQAAASRVTTLGEVVAPQSLELRNQLEGRITKINFASGSQVEQGQLLIQLDIADETASLQAAKARLKLAKLDRQRVRKLRSNNTVSAERLDQAEAQYEIALADIAALEATIDKKTLIAPFTARTGLHQLEAGEFIQANSMITTLIGITDYSWVDFSLPVTEAVVSIGTAITVAPITHAVAQVPGEIIAKNSIVSAESRNLRFRASIPSNKQLPHNSVVNVTIPTSETRKTLTIAASSVRRDKLGEFVFRLIADKEIAGAYRAHRQSIVTTRSFNGGNSETDSQRVSVKQGVAEGDLIATNGSFKLRENLLVYVAPQVELSDSER